MDCFLLSTRARFLLGFCLAGILSVPGAHAQSTPFSGVAWGSPADSVRVRMDTLGFRHVRTYEDGDLRFRSVEDVVVVAAIGSGKLVGLSVWNPVEESELDLRFQAVVDSLTHLLGPPYGDEEERVLWTPGLVVLDVMKERATEGSGASVVLTYQGPGFAEELARREGMAVGLPPLDSTWVVLGLREDGRMAIDTATISRRSEGVYRARVRFDYVEPDPDPAGRFDALIYGYDFDCAKRRIHMRARTALLGGRRVRHDEGATAWVPVGPGTEEAWKLDVVCRFVEQRASATGRSTSATPAPPPPAPPPATAPPAR